MRRWVLILVLTTAMAPSRAQEPVPRFPALLETSYAGSHPDLYAEEQDRVRILVRQAQLEISSQLGLLQYREGFRCPLTVRFDDTPVQGLEHALAYVRPVPTNRGFAQELVVNLDVMARSRNDFDQIFYHEMTHAVLNDAVVSVYGRMLPSWVQEGLAVYISGEGPERVRALAQHYRKSQVKAAVRDLDEPVLDYARDYAAFKYILDKHTINSLQAFVRDLLDGESPQEAIEDATGLGWDAFKERVSVYTLDLYRDQALPDF